MGWDVNRFGEPPSSIDRTKKITNEDVASELAEPWAQCPFSWIDDRQPAVSPSEDNTAKVKGFGNNPKDFIGSITIVEKFDQTIMQTRWWVTIGRA
jgi:hypothetical protein